MAAPIDRSSWPRAALAGLTTSAALLGVCPPGVAAADAPSLAGPPEVAIGGVLRMRVAGAEPGATLERRSGGRWAGVRSVPATGRVALRASVAGSKAFRVREADGELSGILTVEVRPLVLAAGGDVNLGDVPGRLIAEQGAGAPWRSVGSVLRAADLSFVNLECAVSRRGRRQSKAYTFRGAPGALAGARRHAGLDVVNLANNHSMDFGRTALLDTIRNAQANGIVPVGAGRDEEDAYRPRIVERLGLKVAFVGFSQILPFEFRAGSGRAGTAWAFPERVRAGVRAASRQADVVIATFHWGNERDTSPEPAQRALADLALRSGATAVIGAHPHVLQPIRRVAPGRLVAYSLGNFVFGANSPGTARTGVLLLRLSRGRVVGERLLPARIRNGRPVLLRRPPVVTLGEVGAP